ncbi:MAG: biotin/lipoyl-binding protein [Propioniciclava sp.]|uniref:efflux RND transporter periplasmic adaptor subunit n=1 Tax=Propioniciclava sp. TaxID=2038686 RepID=UPI0039E3A39A
MKQSRPRTPWSRRRRVLTIGAVLVVIALIAGVVWWNASRAPAPQPTEVVRAARTTETTTVSLTGVLAPQQQANVSFAVAGTVTSIAARVGERVGRGTELAQIDDRDLRNAVTLAEAQLSAARAQLRTAQEARAVTAAQLAAGRAAVEASEASVEQARSRLADASLTSPIDGVIAQVSIEVGDQVSGSAGLAGGPDLSSLGGGLSGLSGLSGLAGSLGGAAAPAASGGAHIVVIAPGAWKLDAQVGTADLPSIKPGQDAIVTPTGTSINVAAVVDTVGIVASASAGQAATFPVTLKITQPSDALFSGSDADALVTTGTVEGVLTVPGEAIWLEQGESTVRRPKGSTHEVVTVTTGRRFGDRVEILSGIGDGDELIARRSVVVTRPPRPQFGPGGALASPDATPTAPR